MNRSTHACQLADLGVLRFQGADTRRFLQGQISSDIEALAPGMLLRAGLHNPQGRTLALLALAIGAHEDVLAVLPRELCAATTALLRRYVLRARVRMSDESAALRVIGLIGPDVQQALAPASTGGAQRATGAYDYEPARPAVTGADEPPGAADTPRRALLIEPADAVHGAASAAAPLAREQWRALDIAAGLPQVYQATAGAFVAQMLNLDAIGALCFTKGCYTGQEIIARAHYRGQIKRRMQRFLTRSPASLAPGQAGRFEDGRSFRVVEAVVHSDGRCEFLAVAAPPAQEPASSAPNASVRSEEASEPAQGGHEPPLAAQALPLPYRLPER